MKELKLQITGMDCKSCAFLIEDELKNQPGIISASVDFETKKATVSYDEKIISLETIKQVIRNLGKYGTKEITS